MINTLVNDLRWDELPARMESFTKGRKDFYIEAKNFFSHQKMEKEALDHFLRYYFRFENDWTEQDKIYNGSIDFYNFPITSIKESVLNEEDVLYKNLIGIKSLLITSTWTQLFDVTRDQQVLLKLSSKIEDSITGEEKEKLELLARYLNSETNLENIYLIVRKEWQNRSWNHLKI